MFWKIICALFCLESLASIAADIRPNGTVHLLNNEGFVVYLELAKSFGAPKNCWFRHRDEEKVKIDLANTKPIITRRGEEVLPFAANICGLRVSNISPATAARWTLEAENAHEEFVQEAVTIEILSVQKNNFDTHLQRAFGRTSVACSKHDIYTKHCQLSDNENGETWQKCDAETIVRPNKTLECYIYNWGRMDPSTEHIYVDIKNKTRTTIASISDTESSTVLRCQFSETLNTCQAVMPGQRKQLLIMNGLYNGRYSTYDTSVSDFKCSLEIPKPWTVTEQGLWKIINYGSTKPTGCLYYVGVNKQTIIENELKLLDTVQVLKVYQPEGTDKTTIPEISCSVPFVIDDCYLRDPQQNIYFPDSYEFERYRVLGKCAFLNMPIIAGIWTCGIRGHDYAEEVLQDIKVVIKPKHGEVLTDTIKQKRGNSIEFMCKSSFGEPISHCAFMDPQARVHLVSTMNSIKTAGHVQYYGSGIEKGECGIKIEEISSDDYGQWKCQFIIIPGKLSTNFSMMLSESVLGQATSIGLGIGLTVVTVLLFGVVVGTVFYRRRQLTATHNFPSSDPLDATSADTAA